MPAGCPHSGPFLLPRVLPTTLRALRVVVYGRRLVWVCERDKSRRNSVFTRPPCPLPHLVGQPSLVVGVVDAACPRHIPLPNVAV